jgi:hypothetical protein
MATKQARAEEKLRAVMKELQTYLKESTGRNFEGIKGLQQATLMRIFGAPIAGEKEAADKKLQAIELKLREAYQKANKADVDTTFLLNRNTQYGGTRRRRLRRRQTRSKA